MGMVIGFLLGVFRACRTIAGFAKIRSPYQRLTAGIVFNVFQIVIVGAVVTGILLVPRWIITDPYFTVLGFGLLGLFRTPIFRHMVLRICLRAESAMPLRYASFLNYGADLRLLERDGGQWRFRHHILQLYFLNRC
jgi:hypothetical protein